MSCSSFCQSNTLIFLSLRNRKQQGLCCVSSIFSSAASQHWLKTWWTVVSCGTLTLQAQGRGQSIWTSPACTDIPLWVRAVDLISRHSCRSDVQRARCQSCEPVGVCFFTDNAPSSVPLSPTQPQVEWKLCEISFIPWAEGVNARAS